MNIQFDVEADEPITEVETEAQRDDPGVAQFRDALAGTEFHLLEPLHPEVNYSFEVLPADPYTLELRADKWWIGEGGRAENSTLTLNTYDLEQDEVQRETVREELLRIHAVQGLQAAMQQAEDIAIDNGQLDKDRYDPRLLPEGPADRFLMQHEQGITLGDLLEEPPIDLEDISQAHVWQADGDPKTWELDL